MIVDRQVLAVRLRELDHMAEHIPADVLTLRIIDLAIEGAGLEVFDVMDLYERVETHTSAHRIAVLSSREATDEELRRFTENTPQDGPPTPEISDEVQADETEPEVRTESEVEPELESEQPEVEEEPPDLTAETKVETPEPAAEVEADAETTEKTCKQCNESKPLSEFSRNAHGPLGICKPCLSEKRTRSRRGRRAVQSASNEDATEEDNKPSPASEPTKTCTKCDETKPLSEYRGHNKTPDGKMGVCRSCATPFNNSKPAAKKTAELPRDTNGDGDGGDFEDALDYVAEIRSNPRVDLEPKRVNYCVNGEDCVAFEQIGRPTKLAQDNTSGECGGCVQADQQRIRRGEKKRSVRR